MTQIAEHAVLSNYPLSGTFRGQLEHHFGVGTRFINIAELRQTHGFGLIRKLASLRAQDLFIAIEDKTSAPLMPMLELLAALTRARRLGSINTSLEIRRFGRWQAGTHGIALALESILAGIDFLRCRSELRRLARTARCVPKTTVRGAVAYLNCNMWFGVKAGGSVGHISGVANSLMDQGLNLTLFAVGGRMLVDQRARYVPLIPPRTLAIPLETAYYRFHRKCVAQIQDQLQRSGVQFIYQRLSLGNYTGLRLSRELGLPLVLEYNGSEAWVAKNWGRALRFHDTAALAEEVNIQHAHLVVTVSDVLREELVARGVDPDRIVTYPNCIDPKAFDPERFSVADSLRVRQELGFSAEDTVATFIGTFGEWHGIDVLARVIRRLITEQRQLLETLRLKFLLVGDGQKMPLVREALADVDAASFVRLTGLVPQRAAPGYLAASDILLSPHVGNADGTRFFGSPTKLFEYMAMSRGIVASDLDQIGDVLQPAVRLGSGRSHIPGVPEQPVAVLVPPGDEAHLMEAVLLLARNRELRTTLGSNARRLALSRYTWEHHTLAILQGFERVSAGWSASGRAGEIT